MSCDLWQLTYWQHVRTLTTDRLLHQVYTAWAGASNPWLQNIHKLLAEYAVDEEATFELSKPKFVKLARRHIVAKLSEVGQREGDGGVWEGYAQRFGMGAVHRDKPAARTYIAALSAQNRGPAAELCMRMRVQALQLRAMHSHQRRNETAAARMLRESCPCCHQAAESAHHFALECPAYAEPRATMLEVLHAKQPQQHAAILAALPATGWRLLLSNAVLDTACMPRVCGGALRQQQQQQQRQHVVTSAGAVADFVMAAWQIRNAALTGRGANGGNAMA
jgi:hypothetical protein